MNCERNGVYSPGHETAERETDVTFVTHVASRGKISSNLKDPKLYSGVGYRNTFIVHGGDIYVTGIQFFGPIGKDAEFTAMVRLETPMWTLKGRSLAKRFLFFTSDSYVKADKRMKVYGRTKKTVLVKKDSTWVARFDQPVYIPHSKYVDILFEITDYEAPNKSAKSGHLESSSSHLTEVDTEYGKRKIYFMAGSGQMPGFEFQVRPPSGDLRRN